MFQMKTTSNGIGKCEPSNTTFLHFLDQSRESEKFLVINWKCSGGCLVRERDYALVGGCLVLEVV
jgi:hypothetical protein